MEAWSAWFTIAALIGVLLTFGGAWWAVRAFRARRPRPHLRERDSTHTPTSRPGR